MKSEPDWEGGGGGSFGYQLWAEIDRHGACVYVSNQRREAYEAFCFSSAEEIDEFINRLQRAREWLQEQSK